MVGTYPALLQGPTSSGKTSMVHYLAALTGHHCVRINNHHQTDISEYIGGYVSDEKTGQLVFKDGLVQAVRHGWCAFWTSSTSRERTSSKRSTASSTTTRSCSCPNARADQACARLPSARRKTRLRTAEEGAEPRLRGQFMEVHVDAIPNAELVEILERRTELAPPFCKCIVAVKSELEDIRSRSQVLSGRRVSSPSRSASVGRAPARIVPGSRGRGFLLLAERERTEEERGHVRSVIQKHCKGKVIDQRVLHFDDGETYDAASEWDSATGFSANFATPQRATRVHPPRRQAAAKMWPSESGALSARCPAPPFLARRWPCAARRRSFGR